MGLLDNCASPEPVLTVDHTENERHVALAVSSPALGLGEGTPLWIILKANKSTGELTCLLRSSLPDKFVPR